MYKHPNLSKIEKVSATKIFESWILNSKIEKEYKTNGLEYVKNKILEELYSIMNKNLSIEKYNYYEINIKKQKTISKLITFVWNAEASGENNGII